VRLTKRLSKRILTPALCLVAALAAADQHPRVHAPGDAMLHGDALDPATGRAAEIVPGAPWIEPGPDGRFGSADDVVHADIIGDVDIVVRSGVTKLVGDAVVTAADVQLIQAQFNNDCNLDPTLDCSADLNGDNLVNVADFQILALQLGNDCNVNPDLACSADFDSRIPATHTPATAPTSVADAFGLGVPVDFVVSASDGVRPPAGRPVDAPSLEGVPILVMAFADLDGDGFVGITHLDGDTTDLEIEDAELSPVGRRYAIAAGGLASGSIQVPVGGPAGAETRVVLAAAAYAGPFDPAFFGGSVPDGPTVMTHLPFLPRTEPVDVLGGALRGPADPFDRVGAEASAAFTPRPADPQLGEAFTLRTDGSTASVDLVLAGSGAAVRFGLAQAPNPATYRFIESRPLRRGLDENGAPATYEILQHLVVADDGAASQTTLRVVPVDRLGNVADLEAAASVRVRSTGPVRIVSPDADGSPLTETLVVSDARGVQIVVDDLGVGRFDDANAAGLVLEGGGAASRVDAFLPDPDVDDSGLVDALDVTLVQMFDGQRFGDPAFDPDLDLDGDGRIDDADASAVRRRLGEVVAIP
jgi:hypothetical protein